MKRVCISLLVIAVLLSFTGCQLPSIDTDALSTLNDEFEQFLPSQTIVTPTPFYSVSLPVVTDSIHADDGQELFHYTYQNISLTIPDPEVAERIIIDFLNRVDTTTQTAEQLKTDAKNAYQPNVPWTSYLCSLLYTPSRLDSAVFSMYGAYSTYNGAPHPETAYSSITYDMLTGNVLTLQDILTQQTTADVVSSLIISELEKTDNFQLYPDYPTIIKSRFDDLDDMGWYLSANGLCIYFSPYEIAGYASGKIVVEIPYNALPGILMDAYFPSELQTPTGTLSSSVFETDKASEFSQIAELILHNNGSKQLLHTDGIIYALKLELGTLQDDEFQPEATVYFAQSLSATDAVMVEEQLNDQQVLRFSYIGNGGKNISNILQNQE